MALDRLLRSKRPVNIEEIWQRHSSRRRRLTRRKWRVPSSATIHLGPVVDRSSSRRDHRQRRGRGHPEEAPRISCASAAWPAVRVQTGLADRQTPFHLAFVISARRSLPPGSSAIRHHRADGGAVLMPIVASMGGNAGTQTMTVAVRARHAGSRRGQRTRVIGRGLSSACSMGSWSR